MVLSVGSQGVTTAVANKLLRLLCDAFRLRIPRSRFLLAKFEAHHVAQRRGAEELNFWPPAGERQERRAVWRSLEPAIAQLLVGVGSICSRSPANTLDASACALFLDIARDLHQDYEARSTFSHPWNGLVFHSFTEYCDRWNRARTHIRVALTLFVDGFE